MPIDQETTNIITVPVPAEKRGPGYIAGKNLHNARTFLQLGREPRLTGLVLDEGFATARPFNRVMTGAQVAYAILLSDTDRVLSFDDAINAMLCLQEGFQSGWLVTEFWA